MKERFDDLAMEQVEELTDEHVRRWIDVECAHAGVALPGDPPEKPVDPTPAADREVFEVGGLYFLDRGAAERIADALNAEVSRAELKYPNGRWSGDRVVQTADDPLEVSREKHYSLAAYSAIADAKEEHKRLTNVYASEMREWRKRSSARQEVSDHVWGVVLEARDQKAQRATMRKRLEEYCDLADGDRKMGVAFLVKAYPGAEDLLGRDFLYPAELDEPAEPEPALT